MATPVRKVAKPSAPPPAPAPAAAQAPAAPALETKPVPQVDPTAAVPKKPEEPKAPEQEKTCEVRPIHGFPIFIARQNILAKGGVWTLVRHTNWIDTQVKAKILEVQ